MPKRLSLESAKKILIIEDDKDLVELIKYNLEKMGFDSSAAYNGQEGLERTKSEKPDLIILDLMLPVIDGYEFLKIIKEDPAYATIPIIILSAKVSPGAVIKGFRLGAADYIPKPFNVGELISKVKDSLGA
jgi:DNA-binding response OmpR family regulator